MKIRATFVALVLSSCTVDADSLGTSDVLEPIGECVPGQAIRAIAADGTVECEAITLDQDIVLAPLDVATSAMELGAHSLVLGGV